MTRLFTNEQEVEIARRYQGGERARELAEEFHCSIGVIDRVVEKYGARQGSPDFEQRKRRMVMNDWNANVEAEEIASTYGFRSLPALYSYVHKERELGYGFRKRRGKGRDLAMIMTDWNAGMSWQDIAKKHGFPSKPSVTSYVSRHRRMGYGFEDRR